MPTVARISVTPVRTFRLDHLDEVELTERGVVENRRFMLVDADGKRLRSSLTVWPAPVAAEWDRQAERLRVEIAGDVVEGSSLGSDRPLPVRVVEGPWAELLSRRVRLGGAVVRIGGGVGRCAVTTRDPDTSVRDLDTLRLLRAYREPLADGEIPFGVYAAVEEPGIVRVGDEVEPL